MRNADRAVAQRFHRQPLVWLGAVIFAASLSGCIAMIVLAARHPDEPLPVETGQLLKMPMQREPGAAANPGE